MSEPHCKSWQCGVALSKCRAAVTVCFNKACTLLRRASAYETRHNSSLYLNDVRASPKGGKQGLHSD